MKTGKLEIGFLRDLLERYTLLDPQVVVGPKIGEDAAVIDPGDKSDVYWVVTADPITFTTEEIGYYGVVVNINDIATRGAIPRWFLATLLFPEEGSKEGIVEKVFRQIHGVCQRFGISFIGGHTEITPGIGRPILSGMMIGEVKKDRLVTTGGAREGDLLLLVKGVCIEGTSIIAREKGKELITRGIPRSLIEKAKTYLIEPGIEVLHAAQVACGTVPIHAMHDPTEGGLINGIVEMAMASEKEIEIEMGKIYVYEESRLLCQEFDMDPLGTIASGALLLTIAPSDLAALERSFQKTSIPIAAIGRVKKGKIRVLTREGKEIKPLPRDEILKIYES